VPNSTKSAYDGKGVTLAGMIANVRAINTKKGMRWLLCSLKEYLQGAVRWFFSESVRRVQGEAGGRCGGDRQGKSPDP
jgi:hypothetical protein